MNIEKAQIESQIKINEIIEKAKQLLNYLSIKTKNFNVFYWNI